MKGITNRLILPVALIALFGLASCSQVPVDNGAGSGSSSSGGSGSGSGGNAGNGSGGGSGGNTGGGYGGGSGGNTGGGSGGGVTQVFVVQLLASSNTAKAASVKKTFVHEGYENTMINSILRNGQTLHRVQIGPFGTQADAQRVLNQMKRRYKKNQYVNSAVVKTIYGK